MPNNLKYFYRNNQSFGRCFKYSSGSWRGNSGGTDRPFFIKPYTSGRKEQKQNHHNLIIEIMTCWSRTNIEVTYFKKPFTENLSIDVLEYLELCDPDREAFNHIHSSLRDEYRKSYEAYRQIQIHQKSHNKTLQNLIADLEQKINSYTTSIDPELVIQSLDYYLALLMNNKHFDKTERINKIQYAMKSPFVLNFPRVKSKKNENEYIIVDSIDERTHNLNDVIIYAPTTGREFIAKLIQDVSYDCYNQLDILENERKVIEK